MSQLPQVPQMPADGLSEHRRRLRGLRSSARARTRSGTARSRRPRERGAGAVADGLLVFDRRLRSRETSSPAGATERLRMVRSRLARAVRAASLVSQQPTAASSAPFRTGSRRGDRLSSCVNRESSECHTCTVGAAAFRSRSKPRSCGSKTARAAWLAAPRWRRWRSAPPASAQRPVGAQHATLAIPAAPYPLARKHSSRDSICPRHQLRAKVLSGRFERRRPTPPRARTAPQMLRAPAHRDDDMDDTIARCAQNCQ
jgi:hypothetical protein